MKVNNLHQAVNCCSLWIEEFSSSARLKKSSTLTTSRRSAAGFLQLLYISQLTEAKSLIKDYNIFLVINSSTNLPQLLCNESDREVQQVKALNVKQLKEEMYLSDSDQQTATSLLCSHVVLRTRESMSEFKRVSNKPPRNNYSSFFVISFINLLFWRKQTGH